MHHSSSYHFDDDDNSAAAAPPIQTTVIVPSTRSAHVFIRHPTSLLCPPRATLPTYSPAPRPPLPSSFSARQVQASRSNANSWPPLMCRCAAYGASAYDLKANSSYANSTGQRQPPRLTLPLPFIFTQRCRGQHCSFCRFETVSARYCVFGANLFFTPLQLLRS